MQSVYVQFVQLLVQILFFCNVDMKLYAIGRMTLIVIRPASNYVDSGPFFLPLSEPQPAAKLTNRPAEKAPSAAPPAKLVVHLRPAVELQTPTIPTIPKGKKELLEFLQKGHKVIDTWTSADERRQRGCQQAPAVGGRDEASGRPGLAPAHTATRGRAPACRELAESTGPDFRYSFHRTKTLMATRTKKPNTCTKKTDR